MVVLLKCWIYRSDLNFIMANYQTIAPLEGITGKLNKKGKTVFRQKFARDSNGAVISPICKRMIYIKFDCYVRSKIRRELCQTEKGGS